MVGPTQQTGYVGSPATTVPVPAGDPSVARGLPEPSSEPAPIVETEPVEPILDDQSLVDEVQSLNKLLRGLNSRLQFDVYEGTDQLFVQVVDRKSNEVVRTMPPEELLRLKSRIAEAVGVIVDEFV